MKILSILFVSAALAGSLSAQNAAQQGAQPPKTNLKVGDMAPDFTLLGDNWKPVKLSVALVPMVSTPEPPPATPTRPSATISCARSSCNHRS